MVWKPGSKPSAFYGIATATPSKDGSMWRLVIQEKRRKKDNKLLEPEETVVLKKEDVPDNMRKGVLFVRMSGVKDKVYSFHPAFGTYPTKFKSFASKEGEKPRPRTVTDSYGNTDDKFTAVLEITDGYFKGVEVPYFGYYYITRGNLLPDGEGRSFLYSKDFGKSSRVQELDAFLSAIGIYTGEEPIPHRDNLLPFFQKKALQENTRFQTVLENGYVSNFIASNMPNDDDLPPWDGEDEEVIPEPEETTFEEDDELPGDNPGARVDDFSTDDAENWEE